MEQPIVSTTIQSNPEKQEIEQKQVIQTDTSEVKKAENTTTTTTSSSSSNSTQPVTETSTTTTTTTTTTNNNNVTKEVKMFEKSFKNF
jgi:hypothetical protein